MRLDNLATRRSVLGGALAGAAASLAPGMLNAQTRMASPRLARAKPFTIAVPQSDLDSLRARVRAHRWPIAPVGVGWRHGTDQRFMRDLADRWATGYDWRRVEADLNRRGSFIAGVGGRDIHFLYEPGSGRSPKPMLLVHGWPYSILTFRDVIDPLAHPERYGGNAKDGFDVIVPSIPGVGFSERPADVPKGLRFIAERLHGLMSDVLGYDRYLAVGGDFGAVIAEWLGVDQPRAVMGIHQHMIGMRHAGAAIGSGQVGQGPPASAEERDFLKKEQEHFATSGQFAYFGLHMARPETLSMALTDSPVGQAAWIAEKWQLWTDQRDRSLYQIYSQDRLLDEISLYWLTNSFSTSIWPYTGFITEGLSIPHRIEAPVAVMAYPDPLNPMPPRSFVERSRNVLRWTSRPRGGHFPMVEDRDAFIADIRDFGRSLA